MTHLDPGTILSIRDGMLVDSDPVEHLDRCTRCAAALEEARAARVSIVEVLDVLDVTVDAEVAKAAVRARLEERREVPPTTWRTGWPLGRAAGLLLVAAGALSAMPGSPIRTWISGDDPAPEPATVDAPQATPEAGVRTKLFDGRIEVVISGIPAGSEIEVRWVEGTAVTVYAAPGTRFASADGRIEAVVADGPVRIGLPSAAEEASIEVDGRIYLRKTGAEVDVLAPTISRADDRIRFSVPVR
jgi:hypothetical protein